MNKRKLYICYASSDFYARETGISMIGFFENNPDYEPKEFFILDFGILPPNKQKLDGIAKKYGKDITYLPAKQVLEDIQKKLNLKDFRGSLATYSRAFIDKIMPEYVERLLYIDSDTVVVGSISELKSFEMGSACMAGIVSEGFSTQMMRGEFKLYSGNKAYYGCGIVLFDIPNWKRKKCFDRIVKLLTIKKNYPCADQTLINNALSEDCFRRLPRRYNYNTHYLSIPMEKEKLKVGGWYSDEEIEDTIKNTIVVHYAGNPIYRPWYADCISRKKEDYLKYKSMSPWSSDPLFSMKEIACTKGLKGRFNAFVQSIETTSDKTFLLTFVHLLRVFVGKPLRAIGILSELPNEGIE